MYKVLYTPGEKPSWKETLSACRRLSSIAYESDRWCFILVWSLIFADIPLSALTVFATAEIVSALGRMDAAALWSWIAALVGAWFLRSLLIIVYTNRMDRLKQTLALELESRYLAHVIKLPIGILEDPNYQALSAIVSEKKSQASLVFEEAIEVVSNLTTILGLASVAFFIPWQVTLVMLTAMVLRAVSGKQQVVMQWGIMNMSSREGRRAMYYRGVLEKPQLLEKAKGIGLTDAFFKRWKLLASILVEKRLQARFKNSLWGLLTFYLDNIGMGLGMILLGRGILYGTASMSGFVVFLTNYQRIMPLLRDVSAAMTRFMTEAPVVPLIFRVFDIPAESDRGKLIPKESLTVRFESVSFRYPDSDKDVLRDVSFEFQEGDHLALVGLNGAGKTTILKLLMGIYEPTSGKITVNGISLDGIKPSALRRALVIMSQEPARYSDPITEQVYYGDYETRQDKERLETVVEASGLSEIALSLPKGMDTVVGKFYAMPEDRAVELSGGQYQILDITRTLYRDARVYIFDEPTSAVDAEKEESFFSRLPETLAGKAIIFVSHRFSTLRRAKRILVLEEGRLIEDGTHEELIELKGRYAELFTLQAKNYQ